MADGRTRVIIYTPLCRIRGTMVVLEGGRVLDALNTHTKNFFALTDVEILDLDEDKVIQKTDFMAVRKDSIIAVYPAE